MIFLDAYFADDIQVVQPNAESDLKTRVETLEKKLSGHLESENKYNGLAEIRTQDLRRVKVTS